MTTKWKQRYLVTDVCESLAADMAPGERYRPGYVNEVMLRKIGESFLVTYTDGYKTQILDWYDTKTKARRAGEQAIKLGAGGGFTSHFKPNTEATA